MIIFNFSCVFRKQINISVTLFFWIGIWIWIFGV